MASIEKEQKCDALSTLRVSNDIPYDEVSNKIMFKGRRGNEWVYACKLCDKTFCYSLSFDAALNHMLLHHEDVVTYWALNGWILPRKNTKKELSFDVDDFNAEIQSLLVPTDQRMYLIIWMLWGGGPLVSRPKDSTTRNPND